MCKYNHPGFLRFGQHPDDRLPRQVKPTLPVSALERRLEDLGPERSQIIKAAIAESAVLGTDVHLYFKSGESVFGLSLQPNPESNSVKVFEHGS